MEAVLGEPYGRIAYSELANDSVSGEVPASREATGRMVIESYFRGSGGGWVNRGIGGGILGSYQCRSQGRYPKDDDTIVFKADVAHHTGSTR
ncbi:MAG: hypothetical protein IPH55_12645 [Betaproteobacteria bacterium]|nr:hypothetical protein [Betaproteobacteria bacterium]